MCSTVPGKLASACNTSLMPSSIRLAITISPSRVSSSTVPISRMYMRTGSVVRPASFSTATRTAAASSAANSSVTSPSAIKSSLSGACSWTAMPMSLIMLMMSSICSGSEISSGRWSLTSAYVRYPCSLPRLISSFNRDC